MDLQSLTLALGMLFGAIYYQRTGHACGGIITPGVMALYIADPLPLAAALLAGLAVWWVLHLLVGWFGLYGRQRLVVAMLLALLLRWPVVALWGDASLWLGWVVPGLVGADLQRQGAVATLPAVVSCTVVTAMAVELLISLWGLL